MVEAVFGKIELQRHMGKEIRGWDRGKPGPTKEKDKGHDDLYLEKRTRRSAVPKSTTLRDTPRSGNGTSSVRGLRD